ncbi:MAG: (2Fe-2S) ferredoxin domain-containing protein [Cyanobacteria bacterium P01_H01_bin.58]
MSKVFAASQLSSSRPQGYVLKGQYVGPFRSEKGKLKGLLLQAGQEQCAVKLPKYLRPILVRELVPEDFIQVWAYPDEGIWRGINVLPLSADEAKELQPIVVTHDKPQSQKNSSKPQVCLQVCRKGKCYKQGSQKIWQVLQAEVESNPNLSHVSIKATGCMKACKQGPNIRLSNGKILHRVSTDAALATLAKYQQPS